MLRIIKFINFWLPAILWMGLIYFLSSFHRLQASEVAWEDFVIRKTAHFLEYFVLFIFCYRGLSKTTNLSEKKRLWIALLITILYSISDEFHQTLVLGRTGKPRDVLIDNLGGLFGLFIVYRFINILPGRIRKFISA